MAEQRCPCGAGLPLAECCGPLHDGTRVASTAEQLMRARFAAFAVGNPGYLLATWHVTTRPADLHLDNDLRWTALDVVATTGGMLLSAEGTVELRAHYRRNGTAGVQHERSRFLREHGRWWYLDGVSLS